MAQSAVGPSQRVAGRRSGTLVALVLIAGAGAIYLAAVGLALRALVLPAEESGRLFVLFPPAISESAAFAAIVTAGGEPIRPVIGGFGWAAHGPGEGFVGRLRSEGAIAAFREAPAGLPLMGCFGMIGTSERSPPLIRPI
jgi:hypothetical protein